MNEEDRIVFDGLTNIESLYISLDAKGYLMEEDVESDGYRDATSLSISQGEEGLELKMFDAVDTVFDLHSDLTWTLKENEKIIIKNRDDFLVFNRVEETSSDAMYNTKYKDTFIINKRWITAMHMTYME